MPPSALMNSSVDTSIVSQSKSAQKEEKKPIPFKPTEYLFSPSPKSNTKTEDNNTPAAESTKYPDYRPGNRVRSLLQTPLERRLETLVVLIHASSIIVLPFLYFFLWCFPVFWPFLLVYTIFFYITDKTPTNGGSIKRYSNHVRGLKMYKYFASYFPVTLHKTSDLKPTFVDQEVDVDIYDVPAPLNVIVPDFFAGVLYKLKLIGKIHTKVNKKVRTGPRYVFGYHPHGIIAMGVTAGFTMECTGFSKLFPGIRCFVTTLVNQFQLPFFRDYLLSLGITAVTKRNLRSLISQDQSVVIVVGGASESLLAKPGLNSLVLKKRKGFVKMALEMCGKSDASYIQDNEDDMCLVPVYSFGENNIYDVYYTNDESYANKNDGYIKRALKWGQLWLKRTFGFTLPIIMSRGIFNYDFGLLPYRRSIDVVFGNPIVIKRLNGRLPGDAVADEEVDYYHKLYVDALEKLFQENKEKYLSKWDQYLTIVE